MKPRLSYLDRRNLSREAKENIFLTCIFFGSLAGIALCWWLS